MTLQFTGETCPHCHGRGETAWEDVCHMCDGSGRVVLSHPPKLSFGREVRFTPLRLLAIGLLLSALAFFLWQVFLSSPAGK